MHRGFQLEGLSETFGISNAPLGRVIQEEQKSAVRSTLDAYLTEDGKLDAKALSSAWFPAIKADIFISHSHNDEERALRLAGWLKEHFALNSFIDSTVWSSADELLKKIDDKYCKNVGEASYSYEKRNLSTSHVHMMLTMAITEMIDSCECLFFLNTPSSISPVKTINEAKTSSPWIYAEIAISKTIQKKQLPTSRRGKEFVAMDSASLESDGSVPLIHGLDVAHLSTISELQLCKWTLDYQISKTRSPLDILYENIPRRSHIFTKNGV
ncbi:toll/interleukin-1 receptor domain-containing protein [Xanthomonas arboricola]|uniref:toll/interleukin-1 receptor domain-containing protein n=1 Tax=Xanthomonas arboricola TaxID=56448 RepID=UPI00160CCB0B|nr:toll/interleukin-1 receptor domain-containing protein [Xanthomonas arboricola]MBB4597652.1 hypothetical protein [Xanthomonas arboricola]